ncbi:hypothetical protein F5Y10DRAFT_252961 [Nemania abortiva]|nr:hypothetical protein F5Y10DRAFT_252961 [Nemania abortiva]
MTTGLAFTFFLCKVGNLSSNIPHKESQHRASCGVPILFNLTLSLSFHRTYWISSLELFNEKPTSWRRIQSYLIHTN